MKNLNPHFKKSKTINEIEKELINNNIYMGRNETIILKDSHCKNR